MRWDDFQFILAVERGGGLAAAARELRINYSSAHRRLIQIERAMGVRLFERRRNGYHLVSAAQELATAARRIENEVLTLQRSMIRAKGEPGGLIRVSSFQLMSLYVLPRMIDRYARHCTNTRIEILASDDLSDLSHSDADVVIRATSSPPPQYSGIDLGPVTYAGYVSEGLASQWKASGANSWIEHASTNPADPLVRWGLTLHPQAQHQYRFDSSPAACEAVSAGLGAAVLPCLVGENRPAVVRVTDAYYERGYNLWILAHVDMRRATRIRTFMQIMGNELKELQKKLPSAKVDRSLP